MKFALIVPKGKFRSQRENILAEIFSDVKKSMSVFKKEDVEIMPNLGIITIGTLIPEKYEINYLDEEFMEKEEVEEEIFNTKYDVVLITAMDNQALRGYEIADHHLSNGSIVILGGYHASAIPDEAITHATSVLIGEGEYAFREVLEDIFNGRKLKKFYKSEEMVDLTTLPSPRFELFKRFVPKYNKLPLQITRGCPHDCEFCCITKLYGKKHRHKNVSQVIEEIRNLKKLSKTLMISLADENMFVDRKFSKELLRAIIPERIRYEAYSDLSISNDPELLDLIRESGCFEVLIGFETLDSENLQKGAKWKSKWLDKYKESIEIIQGHGVPIMGLFMVGFDHDRIDVFEKIRDFCMETKLYEVDFAIQTPIPGTDLYERYKKEGRLLNNKWDNYTWEKAVYKPLHMSIEELENGIKWLYEEFNTIEMIKRRRRYFKDIISRLIYEE